MDYRNSTRNRITRDFIQGGTGLLLPRATEAAYAATALLARRRAPDRAATAANGWVRWLSPHFPPGSLYFTGTYSDDYGFPHGLMVPRNVHKDFRRFLVDNGLMGHEFINGVEHHRYRDILHLHAVIRGDFSDVERRLLKARWESERGFARALPVLDGCTSYVTKYALKGDTESFDWNLA